MRNLEAVEIGLREAVYRDLCAILEELLNDPALPVPEDSSQSGEKCHAERPKEFLSLFGPVPLHRNYYHSQAKQAGRAPLDQALGLWAGYSPGVLRVLCRLAARFPFEIAAAEFRAYCGLEVQGRQIQRVAQAMGPLVCQVQQQLPPFKHDSGTIPVLYTAVDGTGVPMMPSELEGRAGKQPDGSAKTREVKLGCIFTQTTTNEEGLPVRDYQSTSYVAGFEEAADFMVRVRQEAIRRRMAAALLAEVLCQARQRSAQLSGEPAELATKEIGYFQNNQSRMLYGTYRALGFFYGSGVVEAGCKTVIGGRGKGSGMLWSEPGATHVLDLRCSLFGNQFDQVWDQLNQSDYLRLRILEDANNSHQAA